MFMTIERSQSVHSIACYASSPCARFSIQASTDLRRIFASPKPRRKDLPSCIVTLNMEMDWICRMLSTVLLASRIKLSYLLKVPQNEAMDISVVNSLPSAV